MSYTVYMQLRTFITVITLMTIGFVWEGLWWQEVIDPASVWGDPPQWMYQPLMLIAWAASLHQWIRTKNKTWFVCAAVLSISLLNIPYLHYRNQIHGAPSRSGLVVYWALPYVWSSIMMITVSICSIIRAKKDQYVQLMAYAIILVNVLIRLRPLRPTADIYSLIGPWGTGIVFAILFVVILSASHTFIGRLGATKAVAAGLMLYAASGLCGVATFFFAGIPMDVLWQMLLGGYRHPPAILTSAALLVAALSFDVRKSPVFSALVFALMAYGFANVWTEEGGQLTFSEQSIAALATMFGAYASFQLYKIARKSIVSV
jgi:hypothetical protein